MTKWTFFWCSLATADFTVNGISFHAEVFKGFQDINENADVTDPVYGTVYKCRIYSYSKGEQIWRVAYGEYSPGAYFAYADDTALPFCTPRYKWDNNEKWIRIDNEG